MVVTFPHRARSQRQRERFQGTSSNTDFSHVFTGSQVKSQARCHQNATGALSLHPLPGHHLPSMVPGTHHTSHELGQPAHPAENLHLFIYFGQGSSSIPGRLRFRQGSREAAPAPGTAQGRTRGTGPLPLAASSAGPISGGSGFPQELKAMVASQGLILRYRLCLSHGRWFRSAQQHFPLTPPGS